MFVEGDLLLSTIKKSPFFTTIWGEHELFSPTTLSKFNIFVHVSFLRIESLKKVVHFFHKNAGL